MIYFKIRNMNLLRRYIFFKPQLKDTSIDFCRETGKGRKRERERECERIHRMPSIGAPTRIEPATFWNTGRAPTHGATQPGWRSVLFITIGVNDWAVAPTDVRRGAAGGTEQEEAPARTSWWQG